MDRQTGTSGYTPQEVEQMMTAVKPYLRPIKAPASREDLALVVIDMQLEYGSSANIAARNVVTMINACRSLGIKVIYTQHGHDNVELDGGMLHEFWGNLAMRGSETWQMIPEMQPLPTEHVVHKKTYSGFVGTEFEEKIKSYGATTLIITGVLTNCCCESTARDAFNHGYRVLFVPDATATTHMDLHISSLKTLAYGFAYMLPTAEMVTLLTALPSTTTRNSS